MAIQVPARAGGLAEGARALHIHRFLLRLALSAGNIFAWLIVFRAFFITNGDLALSVAGVAILYALSQAIAILVTPLSGAALRHGVRRALAYGTLCAAFGFVGITLLFAPARSLEASWFWLIGNFVVLMGLHRALYWVPYAASAADEGALRKPFAVGREVAIALMPLLAGLVITTGWLGAPLLFAGIALLILVSMLPVAAHDELFERFEWGYGETFRALVSWENRGALLLSIFDGVQGATLLLIWPLAVFLILNQSFFAVGLILSLTLLITLLSRHALGSILRWLDVERSTSVLATIAFSSWMFRLAAGTPIQIIVADVYYHSGVSPKRHSIDAPAGEQAADGGHFVDEYTALKEIGLALGRIIACVLLAKLVLFFQPPLAFAVSILLAAVCAAGAVILSRRLSKVIY